MLCYSYGWMVNKNESKPIYTQSSHKQYYTAPAAHTHIQTHTSTHRTHIKQQKIHFPFFFFRFRVCRFFPTSVFFFYWYYAISWFPRDEFLNFFFSQFLFFFIPFCFLFLEEFIWNDFICLWFLSLLAKYKCVVRWFWVLVNWYSNNSNIFVLDSTFC